MAASMVAVEMLKLLLLLLLLEDAKNSWDSESPCASFTGESLLFGAQTPGVSCCRSAVPAAAAVASDRAGFFAISTTTATQ